MTTSASKSGVPNPYPVLLNGLVVITVGLLLVSPIGFRYTWAQPWNNDTNLDIEGFTQAAGSGDSSLSSYEFTRDLKSPSIQLNEVTLGDSIKWTLQAIVTPERLYDKLPMYGYELETGQVPSIWKAYGQIVERFGQQKVADGITNINTVSPEPAPADWYVGIADKECGISNSNLSATPLLYNDSRQWDKKLVGRCFMSSKPIHRVIVIGEEIPDPIRKLWVPREKWTDSYNRIKDLLKDSNGVISTDSGIAHNKGVSIYLGGEGPP